MRLIDADAFERRCMFDSNIEDMQDVIYALRDYPSFPAIPIPEGTTNGDMIKAMFPMEVYYGKRAKDYYHFIEWNLPKWWNAPYERGETE